MSTVEAPHCACPRVKDCMVEQVPTDCPVHPMPTLHWLTGEDAFRTDEWYAWFARHGIDRLPQIALNTPIIRNVAERQIVLVEYWEPEDGRAIPEDRGASSRVYRDSFKDVVFRARVVQLDREPDPFPYVRTRTTVGAV